MSSTGSADWEIDRGLQARMAGGLFLVVVFPFAFAVALEWALSTIVPAVTAALTGVELDVSFAIDRRLLAAAVGIGLVAQFAVGDRLALSSVGARTLEREERPALQATVARLAQQADLPRPDVAVIETDAPNAFATGRSQGSATIVVTDGLLERLDEAELEAVLAHEIAHLKNRDVTVMTIAYLLPTLTYLVATGAYTILRTVFRSLEYLGTSHDDDARALAAVIVVVVTTTLVTIAVSALFWIGSFLLYRLLCRYREHAADRGAARLTGDPAALASALATIDEELTRTPDRDLRELDGGVEALYVAPLDFAQFTDEGDDGLLSKDLFPETHPDTAERIERLRAMQRERTVASA
ncbi:M48 family metalloprotease [Halopiger goleimassiliensis]|uniref:M48 family metalloprotease n=1 Tax=Halopiger goleimassiliensis TaxID=1293048 RepID=UPI000A591C30|nr:M48 family metalloprotease [Halopiger goleimassiliensis]